MAIPIRLQTVPLAQIEVSEAAAEMAKITGGMQIPGLM